MISIVIPVYNAEQYLAQCLDSVLGQTYPELEVICVDDGSKDASADILKAYQQKDPRVVICSQANQGLSGARNTGIDKARGEWCMFVDSDDRLASDCCQKAISCSKDTDLVFFSYIREFASKSLPKTIFADKDIIFEGEGFHRLFQRLISPMGEDLRHPEKIDSLSTAWGKLYKTDIIKDHHIQFIDTKEIGTEDLLFNVYYFTYIKSAYYLASCLYHYRKLENASLSSANKPRLIEQWETLYKRIGEWIAPMNDSDLMAALTTRKALCIIGVGLNILFANESHREKYKKLKDFMQKDWYREAVAQLPLGFFPLHWRAFFACVKKNLPACVYVMLVGIYKIIYR